MTRQFISYPKSGRSWLRFALSHIALADQIIFHHGGFEFNERSKPPFDFDIDRRKETYSLSGPNIYLSRDPRDVMISLYFQVAGRFRDFFEFKGDMSDVIRDDYFGAHNLRDFRRMWSELCSQDLAMEITYEDCHRDFPAVLQRVLDRLELTAAEADIHEAATLPSFSRMRAVEIVGDFPEPWLRLRNDSPKTREGRMGRFLDALTPRDIFYLNDVFGLESGTPP